LIQKEVPFPACYAIINTNWFMRGNNRPDRC
jgi:hypothetical protein